MGERKYLNNDWKFTENADSEPTESVRIPHTCREIPYHYFDEMECQMLCKYERALYILPEWEGHTLLLTFEGAAHQATLYINGKKVSEHGCGYTAFTTDISDSVRYGASNRITVVLDTRESLNIPPFGGTVDFLTYGGLYRDVYLDIKSHSYIKDVFIRTAFPDGHAQAISRVKIENPEDPMQICQGIRPAGSRRDFIDVGHVPVQRGTMAFTLGNAERWEPDHPAMYEIKTDLVHDGQVIDSRLDRIGFREAEFRRDGFYLNGNKFKIRGLARSQSYPYVGYAMPDSMQIKDADILKDELGVNAVRSAHYPQSQSFINRCDERGLLVFMEMPGWQYIGNSSWKNQALTNLKEMILQYRNHPSIILWGIRIDESDDDTDFYSRTNGLAHALDPSRQTAGVRTQIRGDMQEDVYAFNDFTYREESPCEKKSAVTSDMDKPYLISAFNGPQYPTKSFDSEAHRTEYALRYARVLNMVERSSDIAGSFGWAFTDFNCHRSFGSGDRICYHGVMDMFRNPKLAAAAYEVFKEDDVVLMLTSALALGEKSNASYGDVYLFTNADSVRVYRNGAFIHEYTPDGTLPIRIDDFIGDTLAKNEDIPLVQANAIRERLNAIARYGIDRVPYESPRRTGRFIPKNYVTSEEIRRLYTKYISGSEEQPIEFRFDAVKDGEVVKSLTKRAMTMHDLEIRVSSLELHDDKTYDVASVRFRALDEFGNLLKFANDPIALKAEGAIELIGPKLITLQGGMGGTYVRTNGKVGSGRLLLTGLRGPQVSDFVHRGNGTPISSGSGGHGYEISFRVD